MATRRRARPLPRPARAAPAAPPALAASWSWLTTVDHKRIGILYGVTAFAFFLLGGLEALIIRAPARAARTARS